MAIGAPSDADTKLSTLVAGILNDAQRLFHQQVELVRSEIQSDFKRTKEASQLFVVGAGASIVAAFMVTLTAVHLLAWATEWPLWICYGGVACVTGALATVLIATSIRKFREFNPLPDETVRRLFESWDTSGSIAPRVPVER